MTGIQKGETGMPLQSTRDLGELASSRIDYLFELEHLPKLLPTNNSGAVSEDCDRKDSIFVREDKFVGSENWKLSIPDFQKSLKQARRHHRHLIFCVCNHCGDVLVVLPSNSPILHHIVPASEIVSRKVVFSKSSVTLYPSKIVSPTLVRNKETSESMCVCYLFPHFAQHLRRWIDDGTSV